MLPADSVTIPPDCEMAIRALWDYLDGETDEATTRAIDEHMAACADCRAHRDFERSLVDRIGDLRREHSDPGRLRSAVLDALRDAGLESEG